MSSIGDNSTLSDYLMMSDKQAMSDKLAKAGLSVSIIVRHPPSFRHISKGSGFLFETGPLHYMLRFLPCQTVKGITRLS